MKFAVTLLAVGVATVILVSANYFLADIPLNISTNTFVNKVLKYQVLALLTAGFLLMLTLKLSPESRKLLQVGRMNQPALKEKWLGINGISSWKTNGLQLAAFISIATGIFMFLAVQQTNSLPYFNWAFVPYVLLFSFTNSLSEEIIYRFAINGNLTAITTKTTVLLLSAILFGLPHYAGFPNGPIGVIMAGVLGYILSKATYETQGIGIAWGIHFLQDVIIFTALFMMNTSSLN